MTDFNYRRIPLFSGLTDEQILAARKNEKLIKLKEGEIFFDYGDIAEYFYFVISGQIKLFRLSASGEEKIIELISPGETFAEAVMFMERKNYPVSCGVIHESELIAINSNSFMNMLKQNPVTSFQMLGMMSQRLRMMINQIDELTLQNATYRLVSYLVQQVPLQGKSTNAQLTLSVPKQILASHLSIKPETLSRLLRKLVNQNLIELKGNQVQIPDLDLIKQYVDFDS